MAMKNLEIHLVDDSEFDREIFKLAFDGLKLEYSLHIHESGIAFLKYIKESTGSFGSVNNLIFLDINMPGMSGFELINELRKMSINNDCYKISILSGSNLDSDREKAKELDCFKYSVKPESLEKLSVLIQAEIQRFIDAENSAD